MRIFLILFAVLLILGCGGDTGVPRQIGRAQIGSLSPSIAHRGQADVEGRIYGSNLEGMSSVSLGDGVDILQANVVSPSELSLHFSVSSNAAPGPRSLTIYAAEGVFTMDQAFTVDANRVPRAAFTVNPPGGFRSTVFHFDASKSQDTDGSITGYRWDLGDGKSTTGKSIEHKFATSGAFDVQLTITDNRGATDSASRFVDVALSERPVALFNVTPGLGDLSTSFHFDASQSHDPDGKIVLYAWNFGDGSSGSGQSASHRYSRTGAFLVGLTVTDDSRLQSTFSHSVVVDIGGGDDDDGGGGGGGGSCDANNFFTNYFNVVSVSGNTITADQSFSECPGLCGEVRRPDGVGVREFVGDIMNISGTSITINTGSLPSSTRPEPGERLNIVWRSCGG